MKDLKLQGPVLNSAPDLDLEQISPGTPSSRAADERALCQRGADEAWVRSDCASGVDDRWGQGRAAEFQKLGGFASAGDRTRDAALHWMERYHWAMLLFGDWNWDSRSIR